MSQTNVDDFNDERTVTATKDLDELIAKLHEIFAHDKVNVDYVKAVLASYKSKRTDWKQFALFDPHRYTRNLVDEGNGKFNLMLLCWNENQGSSIHSHGDSHCFVKVLDGEIMESMFEWPESEDEMQEMKKTAINTYKKEGVTYISDAMGLHRMENPSHSEHTVSLHLYSPPFKNVDTFDEKTGHKNTVSMTFWSKQGERTPCNCTMAPENN